MIYIPFVSISQTFCQTQNVPSKPVNEKKRKHEEKNRRPLKEKHINQLNLFYGVLQNAINLLHLIRKSFLFCFFVFLY